MKKILCMMLALVLCFSLAGCGSGATGDNKGETVTITDSCGREVEIPAVIERVAPSGATTEMVIMTIAPEKLVGLANEPTQGQLKYLPDCIDELPVFGQFYGSKPNLNMETLLDADPQIILDIGDMKPTHKEDMDAIQEQTGIPTVFIEANTENFPEAYRKLGKLLGEEEQGEALALFIEDTLKNAAEKSAEIADVKTVYYGTASDGLAANASGSVQSDVIEIIGAENAIQVPEDEITHMGGGTLVSLEELYNRNPDVILFTDSKVYDDVMAGSKNWAGLDAVKKGSVYLVPALPYCWMSMPPSVNRLLGIWWLGYLTYPEVYDHDMAAKTVEYYKTFWHYDMTEDEAKELLGI